MRNNTQDTKNSRLVSFRRWGLPFLGLALVFGIVTDRSKPVLSNQLDNDPYSYRVQLPDSGAYFETWKEQPSNNVTNDVSNPEQSMITAIVPDIQRPASKSTTRTVNNYPKQDGVYLYGQSPQPAQIGQGYVVFEKKQGRVTGALYMPDSEFSCFNGTVDETGELAMTVNPNATEASPTQVATGKSDPKLNIDEPTSYAYSIALRDFHPIDKISSLDRQILNTCQAQ